MSNVDTIISNIKKDGAGKLHVLSDFDRTLTKPEINGKQIPSLISVLRDNGYLSEKYVKKAHELFNTYHAIEIDPDIPLKEKRTKMEEWWRKHFALLIESGLMRDDIKHAMTSRNAQLRDGAHDFFNVLEKNNIPLVIMSSSGLGIDSIQMFLEAEKEMRNNISIISNQYTWDEDGKAIAVKEPIIHGMNKDETLIENFPEIFRKISNRTNVLLLGDSDSDLGMAHGFAYKYMLTIGFVQQDQVHSIFDVTLDPSSSLTPVTDILARITH